jgi:hypothetical protein
MLPRMGIRARATLPALVALALLAGPVASGLSATNLRATPAVKAALRAAHLRMVPAKDRAKVRGPLPGSTYYAGHRGREYALAVFSHPRTGTTDQPELFTRKAGGRWVDRGDTGGDVCSFGIVPKPVLDLWAIC